MNSTRHAGALDIFHIYAAFLVVAIHTSPLWSFNETADFILTRIIARVAVPFFIMVSGYFLFPYIKKGDWRYIWRFCKKMGILYGISIILYLPLNIYAGRYNRSNFWLEIPKDILFDGTFYHLWYFPALLIGVVLVTLFVRIMGLRITFVISTALYMVGLFGDSYYGVASQIPFLNTLYDQLFAVFDYTRNGVFLAPIYLVMGGMIFNENKQLSLRTSMIGLAISSMLLIVEGLLLDHFSLQRHDSMYVMLIPCMYFLFQLLLRIPGRSSKSIRDVSLLIYLIHPWMIVFIRGFSKLIDQQKLLIETSLIHYLLVSILSIAAAGLISYIWQRGKKPLPSKDSRAWIEIDLEALVHNAQTLQKLLPKRCKLMAVVKANAYGHGDVVISKTLNQSGIHTFAVATLSEGIRLRTNGIKGDILILGYTNPTNVDLLRRYHLTQTVVDYSYAKRLNDSDKKIMVHVKIDTGMHRLGIDSRNLSELERIFNCNNLVIEGVFSHLSVSDSLTDDDIAFTNKQLDEFYKTIEILESKGFSIGKIHIQSSYGILNYPNIPSDYARAGLALYGVLSKNDKIRRHVKLQPVLSLKARIAAVKEIQSGEAIGYGRTYTAKTNMKIAVATIGYADGIPRHLSETNSYVLLHSKKAPIIGRICMDQIIIDVSYVDEVKANDVVTIIGRDGVEQIHCQDLAEKCGTITNEILSKLGSRLPHVFNNVHKDMAHTQ